MMTRRSRMRRRRRVAWATAILLLAISVTGFVIASAGDYATYPRDRLFGAGGRTTAPAWTAGCRSPSPSPVAHDCVHVRGHVVWRQTSDSDGDGDRHLVVAARRDLHVIKLARWISVGRLPRLGASIDAVGYAMEGSRGRDEVNVERLEAGGHVYRARPESVPD